MTITQKNTIDVVGIDREKNILTLMIQDDLKWDKKNEKLLLLQDKLNAYLDYIRSGEVYKKCPEGKGLEAHIILASKYPPNAEAEKFLSVVEPFVAQAGYHFKCAIVGAGSTGRNVTGENADENHDKLFELLKKEQVSWFKTSPNACCSSKQSDCCD